MSHPKDRIPPLSRREFLRRAAMTGVAVPSLAAILAACGSDEGGTRRILGQQPSAGGLQLARPDNPITLAITDDNPAIADGLSPEAGPLKIFGYNDYIYKKVRNQFGDRYGVDVEYTVFDTPDEMVAKMQSNGSDFDSLVTVTLENVGKLAQGGLIQPLNKTYLPTFEDQLWTGDPRLLRRGPAVLGAVRGVHHRHLVAERPDHRRHRRHGQPVRHLLGHREQGPGPPVERQPRHAGDGAAPRRLRPERPTTRRILDTIKQDLLDGADAMGGSTTTWTTPSSARTGGRSTARGRGRWSITSTTCRRAWTSRRCRTRGRRRAPVGKPGLVSHDLFAISKGAANPVLAHKFIDFMYEPDNALTNYTYEGYQPTVLSLDKRRRWTRATCRPAWTTRS